MFKTMRKYPNAQVMKAGVNKYAHLFQAVKQFVGHTVVPCVPEVEELLCSGVSVTWRIHAHHSVLAAPEPLHISPAACVALSLLLGDPLIPPPLPLPWALRTQHPFFIL